MHRSFEGTSSIPRQSHRPRDSQESGFLNAIGNMNRWVRVAIISLGLLNGGTGCGAPYKVIRSGTVYEPIKAEVILEEIPSVTINAKLEEQHLDIHVERIVTRKHIRKITEQEFKFEEREAQEHITSSGQKIKEDEASLGVAALCGLIGAGSLKLAASESRPSEDYEKYKSFGNFLIGSGIIFAAYGTYVVLRSMDSKEATGKTQVVDQVISKDINIVAGDFPINLQIGDKSFSLGSVDGHLRLSLQQLALLVPKEQLAKLLNGEKVFVTTEGAQPVAVDATRRKEYLAKTEIENAVRELRTVITLGQQAELRGDYKEAEKHFYRADTNVKYRVVNAYQSAGIPIPREVEELGIEIARGLRENQGKIGIPQIANPQEPYYPGAGVEAGARMLFDEATAAAPHVADAILGIAERIERMGTTSGNSQTVAASSPTSGEIEVETGATGYLSVPCTDTRSAIRAGERQSKTCTTLGEPACVISNLAPGKYLVRAERSGGCKKRKAGPIEVEVKPGERTKVDFSRKFAR